MAYIGNSPENIQRGKRFVYEFKATAGQTAFSGTDLNNQTLDLLEENEMGVYLNGVRLADSDDYNVSGDTLTLISAASLNDQLTVETQAEIANISSYTRAEADARYINYDGDIVAGDLQISGEVDAGSLIVDTNTLVVDATNNRVGINTTTPSYILDVDAGTSDWPIRAISSDDKVGIILQDNDTVNYLISADNTLSLGSSATVASTNLTIKSDGKIGIGTSSPSYPLHISGTGHKRLKIEKTDAGGDADLQISSPNDSTGWVLFHDNNSGNNSGVIKYVHSTNKMHFRTNDVDDRLVISSDGNVGIGTDSPARPLHVTRGDGTGTVIRVGNTGTSNATIEFSDTGTTDTISIGSVANDLFLKSDDGDIVFATTGDPGTASMTVKRGGNVGIGTASPTVDLDVTSSSNPFILLKNTTSGSGLYIKADDGGDAELQTAGGSNTIIVRTSGVARTKLTSNGALLLNSSGYVKTDAAQTLTIGDGNSSSAAGIDIIRGEPLSGGTGPYIRMYHGPDSSTQTEARISSVVGDLRIEADRNNVHNSSTIDFHIDGAQVLSLASNGNLLMNNGAGISFAATGNTSGTSSEILDDYEEGTWTPRLVGSSSESGQSYAVQQGDYTKIGNQVICRFGLTMSAAGSFSGYIMLDGFPFNIENNPPTVHLGNIYFVNVGQNIISVGLQGYENDNKAYLWIKTTASTSREYPNVGTFITNNTQFTGSFTFQTTS